MINSASTGITAPMRVLPLLLLFTACGASQQQDAGMVAADAGTVEPVIDSGVSCLALEPVDANAADAGRAFLFGDDVGGTFIPRLAWDNLWLAWGGARPADLPAAMRARYGFVEALTPNDGLPMGLRQVGTTVHADCLLCHAGRVAGQTVVGAPNTQLDLELLVDDLKRLAMLAGTPVPNVPPIHTGARGVSDIIGMTLSLALQNQAPPFPVNTEIGFQDPPAWWALRSKTRAYTDGSAPGAGHRTFMATQLAFGATQTQLERLEPRYIELRQYLLSLEPPAWPFAQPETASLERGRALFRARCVSCHRDDRCERAESIIVPRGEVGTDALRSERYGANEVALINGSWFGASAPHQATAGYLAPSLRGVWASAPYFHNGSVPTLRDVLDSTQRPAFFQLIDGYDEMNVGARVLTFVVAPSNPPRADRAAVFDTTKAGLGNKGHVFGDGLTAAEREDLLGFLKTQ